MRRKELNWEERNLLIVEFTRPNGRGERSLHKTDTLKTARYTPLRDLLAFLEVSILTFNLSTCALEGRTYQTDGLRS